MFAHVHGNTSAGVQQYNSTVYTYDRHAQARSKKLLEAQHAILNTPSLWLRLLAQHAPAGDIMVG